MRSYRSISAPRRADKRDALINRTRREVQRRSGGRCEYPGCGIHGTDLAHGFKRGNLIGMPLCDTPMCCYWSCRAHNVDHPCDELRWTMVQRVEEALAPHALREPDDNPVDAMLRIERALKAEGTWADIWEWAA